MGTGHATGVIGFLRHQLRRGRRWLQRRRTLAMRVARLEAEVEHLRHGLEASSALYERRLDQLTARLAEMEARTAAEAGGEARVAQR
jgi:hypothetical protein